MLPTGTARTAPVLYLAIMSNYIVETLKAVWDPS
jgi:hypothetical protein